jgi:hypothetical protein
MAVEQSGMTAEEEVAGLTTVEEEVEEEEAMVA